MGEESAALTEWRIPCVILGIFKAKETGKTEGVLEIVRKTFVYINSYAEIVNASRKILLNDESVNALCTQELIQACHSNDVQKLEDRDESKLPLIFFDWRGETSDNRIVRGPAAVKTIVEIHDWFLEFLLGDDGGERQETVLELDDVVPPLESFARDKQLTHRDALKVRNQYRKTLAPGLVSFLENFSPYKDYIAQCRAIEREANEKSDLAAGAFMKLRFGSCQASEDVLPLVLEKYDDLVGRFEELKNSSFPELLSREIGMRGVMYAFSESQEHFDRLRGEVATWEEYAEWFCKAMNAIHEEGWFESYDALGKEKRKLMTHIAFDGAGAIVNYKFNDIRNALGTLLVLFTFHYGKGKKAWLGDVWEEFSDSLKVPLRRGFRKRYKQQLQDTFKGTLREFGQEINKRADSAVGRRLKELSAFLGLD